MPGQRNGNGIDLVDEVGFCFLKPDYVDIEREFTEDLSQSGLTVVHRRPLKMPPRLIDYVYSDSRGEDFYPTMRHELANRAICAMVVAKSDADRALPAQHILESLKRGSNGYPNLREKYHRREHVVDDRTFAGWQSKELPPSEFDNVAFRLTQQNVFHASDGPHDGIGTLLRLRERSDFPGNTDFFGGEYIDTRVLVIIRELDNILKRHKGERDMSKIKREWRIINEMPTDSSGTPIRQVYTWVLTKDQHVVIVSKDGRKWQFPGGKPDNQESVIQTAIREVREETGIDMTSHADDINFFGEYTIDDRDTNVHPPRYRQVRSWLQLPVTSEELVLSTAGESQGQRPEDAVRFVRAVPTKDILTYMGWLENTDEYKALKRNKIIDRAA